MYGEQYCGGEGGNLVGVFRNIFYNPVYVSDQTLAPQTRFSRDRRFIFIGYRCYRLSTTRTIRTVYGWCTASTSFRRIVPTGDRPLTNGSPPPLYSFHFRRNRFLNKPHLSIFIPPVTRYPYESSRWGNESERFPTEYSFLLG